MQKTVAELGYRVADGTANGAANPANEESLRDLAKGVDQLIRQMRTEQKIVREWVDEQAAQQSEVASVLKELAGNIGRKPS
jgi:hypothetical protein